MHECRKVVEDGYRILVTTLTKKMAEDLTDYLIENNLQVRYLHSDIDTLERMEIIRDLRLGEFDILVGINLLREGLDIPECGLVAILDADKEGFLRSKTSLIQTIGRAARNVDGRVILYADVMTGSMEQALKETDRRRQKQINYNEQHNISPKTVTKKVDDLMYSQGGSGKLTKTAENKNPVAFEPEQQRKRIEELKRKMLKAAENLEFEEAAKLRDEIKKLEENELGL